MFTKQYIRDKRSPIPKDANVSRVMSANKAKDSKPELMLRHKLREYGMSGYRLHYDKIPGRPDICFVSKKFAIFVNGCFWHRCPHCNYPLPKNNTDFWIEKFNKNQKRDKDKIQQLQKLSWTVLTIWECQIKNEMNRVLMDICNIMDNINNKRS